MRLIRWRSGVGMIIAFALISVTTIMANSIALPTSDAREAPIGPLPNCVVNSQGVGWGCLSNSNPNYSITVEGQFSSGGSFFVTGNPTRPPCLSYYQLDDDCYSGVSSPELGKCVYLFDGDPNDARPCLSETYSFGSWPTIYQQSPGSTREVIGLSTVLGEGCSDTFDTTYVYGGPTLAGGDTSEHFSTTGPQKQRCEVTVLGPRPDNLLGPTFLSVSRRSAHAWVQVEGDYLPGAPVAACEASSRENPNGSYFLQFLNRSSVTEDFPYPNLMENTFTLPDGTTEYLVRIGSGVSLTVDEPGTYTATVTSKVLGLTSVGSCEVTVEGPDEPTVVVPPVVTPPTVVQPPTVIVPPTVEVPTFVPPTVEVPTFVPPTVEVPTFVPPTVVPPTVVPPTVVPPTVVPPTVVPPTVVPPTVEVPTVAVSTPDPCDTQRGLQDTDNPFDDEADPCAPEETESPTSTPTASPTPTPSPIPNPTQTPTPEPVETPTPEPTETSAPAPTETPPPDSAETATPEPTEEEEPTPDPTEPPIETPAPEPTEEEEPTPNPTEPPIETPAPDPTSSSTPEPERTVAPQGGQPLLPAATPDPIVGPLVSGSVTASIDEVTNLLTITVPGELSVWLDRSDMSLAVGGETVYEGSLPASGKLELVGARAFTEGTITLEAKTTDGAPYSESLVLHEWVHITQQRNGEAPLQSEGVEVLPTRLLVAPDPTGVGLETAPEP